MFRGGIGAPEILIILGIVVLLFGGRKLPELARGSGRALRIFKTEVTALHDDDDDKPAKPASLETVEASEADKKREQG
ncbi:twin-arginine translocase TatA/TatE family subunit [Aeromicrobium chenweiae]|uniref:Sec-independent protein translocase protein TatA n=1 Tax=Aeromicrobium chenweiae TaxID=2079793 RepID=A0A2S0WM53_9ACTN|nr:twin-arginine translocase TatA/TatE family subunit [Aeromicrobium chenweiae]AWB92391.1 twin-arginine translocase TatA/TatE family subunit [Aeromicrobium chenweiae]TGN31322.1 twin-arginine translocase TatA/TatE family subunit [Aeromicrobium chenweiae]